MVDGKEVNELIATSYFSLREDKIVGLTIILNEPSPN